MPTTSRATVRHRELQLALGEQINALISATRAFSEHSAASFEAQLQPAAFHIARWLHSFGPARPSVIADAVHMDRSSTSVLIGRMSTLGLVDRVPDPADRRGVVVGLTAEGHARVAATLEERGGLFFERTGDWTDDDLERLVALLQRLTAG